MRVCGLRGSLGTSPSRGTAMNQPKPGTYDPKKGGKFEPTTKAVPPPPPPPGRKKN